MMESALQTQARKLAALSCQYQALADEESRARDRARTARHERDAAQAKYDELCWSLVNAAATEIASKVPTVAYDIPSPPPPAPEEKS